MSRKLCAGFVLAITLALAATVRAEEKNQYPIADGPFKGSLDSLKQYKYPDWFRDAKFGIWAHWGPQAVPMDGDWYARGMYEEGSGHYKHHLEHYGHPSEHGYKEIIDLWKAEKWDPERLMALYKKAGAKYFVSMGSHHDNFHLWNSKHHKWNAVNMGPKRDVVATWQKAAKAQGLRFGVSEHLGASFTWFQSSHRADKKGPKAGIPYDGANPEFQNLYHFPADPKDTGWYSNNPKWHKQWFDCITDLIDNYHLDLLYTDGGVPFGNEVGMSMIAHLYNTDIKNRGNLEVVYNCKQASEGRWVEDLERGVMPRINPTPWQTDTSIGDWFYNKNWKFRPVTWVIHMLVDIVSKNGNLLLNVVQRPDGSLDPEVEQMLGDLAAWNEINGEAIFGTRPWLVYGEGATRARGGHFNEDYKYSAKDIRFTTKGGALYAIALGRPTDGQIVIRSLAKPADGGNVIQKVSLVGSDAALEFKQTAEALIVTIPEAKGEAADAKAWNCTTALKILGTDLKAVPFSQAVEPIGPDRKGNVKLDADSAELHGTLQVEHKGVPSNLGFWDHAGDWVSWKVKFDKAGSYQVSASCSALSVSEFVVEAAGQQLTGKTPVTGDWGKFQRFDVGRINIAQPGEQVVKVRPADAKTWKPINLAEIVLKPAK